MSVFRERYEVGDKVWIDVSRSDQDPRYVPAVVTDTNPQINESLIERALYQAVGLKRAVVRISEDSPLHAGEEAVAVNDRYNRRDIIRSDQLIPTEDIAR